MPDVLTDNPITAVTMPRDLDVNHHDKQLVGLGKAVVVHAGARDAYQLALALSEAGLLDKLVTDLFWPSEHSWTRTLNTYLPASLLTLLRRRSSLGLPSSQVMTRPTAGLGGLLLDKLPRLPFTWKRYMVRSADKHLGRSAGRRAKRSGAGLISYSYTGYDAFGAYGRPGLLFQVHPHPATMRRILLEELDKHPECSASLKQEWELSLPETDFQKLVNEVGMASHFLAASSFTRQSLIENGTPANRITVVPYGVDLDKFQPDPARSRSRNSKLRLLFVGRINQRKGVKYLLETINLLQTREIELIVCGRVLDDLELFKPFLSKIQIRPSVSEQDLIREYQSADLFVFPSVGEGFGQVLLESLACGLPILSTTHTAAPDLIEDGVQGFINQPRQPHLMAEQIEWALSHRDELNAMRILARERAEHFTWQRFRRGVAETVRSYLTDYANSAARSTNV